MNTDTLTKVSSYMLFAAAMIFGHLLQGAAPKNDSFVAGQTMCPHEFVLEHTDEAKVGDLVLSTNEPIYSGGQVGLCVPAEYLQHLQTHYIFQD